MEKATGIRLGSAAVAILAIAAYVTFGSPPAEPKGPAVEWTPSSLSENLLAGETLEIALSLKTNQALQDVVIRVVPEFKDFVSVSSSDLGNLAKGQTVSLTVTIAPEATALPETLDGTIQLHRGTRPSRVYAQPLPVEVTIEWQSFENPDGGYSLVFPPTLEADFVEDQGVLVLAAKGDPPAGTEVPALFISIDENGAGLSIQDFYDGNPGVDMFGQSGNQYTLVSVGGRTGYEFEPFVSLAGDVIVVVPRGEDFLVIHDYGAHLQVEGLFDAILDSIVF